MTKKITIDANGQKLGRLATKIASILMGKDSAEYMPNLVVDVKVEVVNADKLDINPKKMAENVHQSYSGYPGGRKVKTWAQVVEKKGVAELLKVAVKGMLPKNKLQDRRLKNLIIK